MEENNQVSHLSWQVPEHDNKSRDKRWYLIALGVVIVFLFFCFFEITLTSWPITVNFLGVNSNFLFALIIVMSAMVLVINDGREAIMVDFEISPEGINIGRKFYDYDDLRHFSIIYKPNSEVKNLYIECKNSLLHPRLSIPLYEHDPIEVRSYLLRYLDEDLERMGPPLSEQLTKILKL